MAALDDFVLLLHATDAVQWAQFISTRLAGPQYNITSIAKDVMTLKTEAFPCSSVLGETPSNPDTAQQKTDEKSNTEAAKDSSTFRDSGRCSRNAVTETSSIPEFINSCKACVVFISPDFLDLESPFSTDVTSLNPSTTVYLLLGVEIEETRAYFAEKSDHVFQKKSYICLVDGTETTICEAMVNIIQAYENPGTSDDDDLEEDIYKIPPSPVQRNTVVKVFPKHVTEEERDVYVLLQRPAENEVLAVLEVEMSQEVPLTCVCGQLYRFTIPGELHGEIKFKIECQSHVFGMSSVKAYNKLEQLNDILNDLVDPIELLTSALNIDHQDLGGLDTVLAFRLQQLASSTTFKTMFQNEDLLNNSEVDESSTLKYPSLLHFAADLNLRLFCSELLHYPGMLGAACTENVDREFPCQIASRKGFWQLEKDLIHFVEERKGACDDPFSPPSTPPSPTPDHRKSLPPPPLHIRKSPGYVNDTVSIQTVSDYIDMGGVQNLIKPSLIDRLLPVHKQRASFEVTLIRKRLTSKLKNQQIMKSDPEHMSPSSECSDSVFSSSPTNIEETLASQRKNSLGTSDNSSIGSGTLGKAFKVLGIGQNSGSNSSVVKQFSSSAPGYDPMRDDGNSKRFSVSSGCENVSDYIPNDLSVSEKKANKFKSFFSKITGNKKSVSEDDGPRHSLNKSYSNRSNKSSKSTSSETPRTSKKKKLTSEDSQERDSGSFSDEEKSSTSATKKYSKPKTFKDREKPMMRTLSKRAQLALNDTIDNAPTLPKADRRSEYRKSTFKSFIKDQDTENF